MNLLKLSLFVGREKKKTQTENTELVSSELKTCSQSHDAGKHQTVKRRSGFVTAQWDFTVFLKTFQGEIFCKMLFLKMTVNPKVASSAAL